MRTQTKDKINTVLEETKSNGELVRAAMSKATTKGTLAGLKHTDIQTVISGMKAQIAQALPKHITADRIIQIATTQISRNPAIAECTATSLVGAIMQVSILGLELTPQLGQAYLVPTKNKGKLEIRMDIGYKGYIRLARNSGEIKTLFADVIRHGDEYEEKRGAHRDLIHIPNKERNGHEKISHAYAVVHYLNGGFDFENLTFNEIEFYRNMSESQKKYGLSGAWKNHYAAMAKKTAIRRLATFMPLSIEIQYAKASDGAVVKEFTNTGEGIDLSSIEYPIEEIEEANFSEQSRENCQAIDLNGGEKNA